VAGVENACSPGTPAADDSLCNGQTNNTPSSCVAGVENACSPGTPAADDSLCNGLDDDCDGSVDEDYAVDSSCGTGECQTNNTPSSCVAGVENACTPGTPAADDSLCNGLDDDCDGSADEDYVVDSSCGVGECQTNNTPSSCVAGVENACTPGTPAADDSLCNGLDDDCDGSEDEDYVVDSSCGVGECQTNNTPSSCVAGVENVCSPGTPAADDSLCNGLDDDCDGSADEDYVVDSSCGGGECQTNNTPSSCVAGVENACSPGAPAADDSLCNGLDDDCDGSADEDYTVIPTTCGTGECAGNTGQLECQGGAEIDTCDPLAGAAADDSLCNGLDDDCDGSVDEDYTVIPTTCGTGECAGNAGQLECQGGTETDTCDPLAGAAAETCDNLDNNCDGAVDEGLTIIYYHDFDSDNYGNPAVPENACSQPVDYVQDDTDCDDTDPAINPETFWYQDYDFDGYGNQTISMQQCTQPSNFVLDNSDCNDNDPEIYPGGHPVRITPEELPLYYPSLQHSYNAISDGQSIQCQDKEFIENLSINADKSITLEAGYDCGYSINGGMTTITGTMTVIEGTITIQSGILIIQ
jgi:hypothetical protein